MIASNFQPSLEIELPATVILRHHSPQFDPRVQDAPDFAAFVQLVALPILRIADAFVGDTANRWSIMPIPARRFGVWFCLVYKRRFTVTCQVRSSGPSLILISCCKPSKFLACGLSELRPSRAAAIPGSEQLVVRLKLEQFARATVLIETFCELFDSVVESFGSEGIELSKDLAVVTVSRRIGAYLVKVEISGGTVNWVLDGSEQVAAALNKLIRLNVKAQLLPTVIAAAAHLIGVFLPVNSGLVVEVLELMSRIAVEIGFEIVGKTMESAMVLKNGSLEISFSCGSPFTIEFPPTYRGSKQWIIRRATGVEKFKDFEQILRILRGS